MKHWVTFLSLLAATSAFADVGAGSNIGDDTAFLDPQYSNLNHPADDSWETFDGLRGALPAASDTEALIAQQTAVKSQGARGTCSIFSATALLESLFVIQRGARAADTDFSEEWLEYLVMRNKGSEGSSSTTNFTLLARHGTPDEAQLPYVGETWKTLDDSQLARTRCGHLRDLELKSCLLGHRDSRLLEADEDDLNDSSSRMHDPEFATARRSAKQRHQDHIQGTNPTWSSMNVDSVTEAKQLLAQGVPITLDIDFYYGAWNHRKAPDLGIPRDMNQWEQGIVNYPERGSKDRINSAKESAGHSVVIVGYDDNVVVETRVEMANGSTKVFKHKGVYYFKNSWGSAGFGAKFMIGGHPYPGYGMITQDYANEIGAFYRLPLRK